MTRLTDLMSQGYQIQISELVTPGTVFPVADPANDRTTLVFHPFDYSYISNDDIFVAHEINMLRIYKSIEDAYEKALAKLDAMIYEMEHKHDPRVVTFLHNVEVIENEDGTFTFYAQGDTPNAIFDESDKKMTPEEIMRMYG